MKSSRRACFSSQVPERGENTVQRYISDAYLIDGRKVPAASLLLTYKFMKLQQRLRPTETMELGFFRTGTPAVVSCDHVAGAASHSAVPRRIGTICEC